MHLPFASCGQVADDLAAHTPAGTQPLWLLCIADRHGDQLQPLTDTLRARGLRACGGVFPGLVHGADCHHDGLIAIALPASTRLACADLSDGVDWREPPPCPGADERASIVVLVDCLAPSISALLEDIGDRCGQRHPLFGAGAGWGDLRPAASIFTPAGPRRHAALLLVLPRSTTVQVRHGWQRVRGPFIASRTDGNVIHEINWERAGAFYRRQVAEQQQLDGADSGDAARSIDPAYPLAIGRDSGEDLMRDPIGYTAADALVVLSDVPENSVLYLARGSKDSLLAATRDTVGHCEVSDAVRRCFVVDCHSRALMFGADLRRELLAVQQAVARRPGIVPMGVLAQGEIAAAAHQPLELLNKTFVVAFID